MKEISFFLLVLILLTSCQNNNISKIDELDYGKPVKVTVAWNDTIYEVTDIEVDPKNIGKRIGVVQREVSPRPEKNGDIARNTPEGPKITDTGNLFEIKNDESELKIAIEMTPNKYYECNKFTMLK